VSLSVRGNNNSHRSHVFGSRKPEVEEVAVSMLEEMPPTISVVRAGEFLGMSPSAAYRAVQRGELPTISLAGRLRVPTPRLLNLLGYSVGDPATIADPAD
jgi:hypothetical protein